MIRTLDASFLNHVANHPEVRPWLGGEGALDLQPLIADPANIALVNSHGGFVLHKLDAGSYEVHTLFLPDGRGEAARDAMRDGLRYMFCATDCIEILTKCPDDNKPALGLARAAGFQEMFRRENAWANGAGVSYQRVTLERWRARADLVLEKGAWFHEKLEAAKIARGSELPIHDDDEAHDRAVGASVMMAMSGNPRKAVWAYNRWARFAGYAPILLLSEAPPVIDVVDAIVAPKGDDMEILLCR